MRRGECIRRFMYTFECSICRKTFRVPTRRDAPFRPFCSYRCKMVDLGKWLSGEYVVSEPIRPDELEKLEHKDEPDQT